MKLVMVEEERSDGRLGSLILLFLRTHIKARVYRTPVLNQDALIERIFETARSVDVEMLETNIIRRAEVCMGKIFVLIFFDRFVLQLQILSSLTVLSYFHGCKKMEYLLIIEIN
jgi:hypothetical protein